MINAIFNGLFKVLNFLLNFILTPINRLVVNFFPDFNQMISSFNTAVDTYLGNGLGYFFSLLPEISRYVIVMYLTLLIGYYTLSVSLFTFTKIWSLIQKIKVW